MTTNDININKAKITDLTENLDRMEEWEEQIVTETDEYFNDSSDDIESEQKIKINTKLKRFKNGLTKKVMSSLKDDTKEKGGMMIQIFKEEWKNTRKSPDRPMTASTESLNSVKDEPFNELDKDSDSKLKKLKSGLGKKIKDIREDIVDIRDESLHSLSEFKEIYQEKAEQKKAMITSFTEEEVKIFRKGSPLPPQVTKQMSSVYLARRYSIIRFTILGARKLDISRVKETDNVFVKLSLGLERFKTKQVSVGENPHWMETSSLPRQTEEDKDLTVEVFARGSKETLLLGAGLINLGSFKNDSQNQFWLKLDGGFDESELEMVIWVTGVNTDKWLIENAEADNEDIYTISKSFDHLSDVGILTISVIEATGLGSSKLQGSVNPACLLQMDNQFHRTVTAIKTKNPAWDKCFSFSVSDPFSLLNITVISEKMNSPPLVLGRAVLRLSNFHSSGKRHQHLWVRLKDRKLRKSAKGDSPKLHLEIKYTHNIIRSAITVFKNKDDVLFEVQKNKFDRTILLKNVNRIKQFLPKGSTINNIKKSYSDIIAWHLPVRTVKYFVFYMFFVYYFHIWWIPVFVLYCLAKNWNNKRSKNDETQKVLVKTEMVEDEEDEEEETLEEKKSLKQSLDSLQNILQEFQEGCGLVASYFERVSNLCHFEEPFLSLLFCGLLVAVSLVLWFFGLRTVLLLWGVNKFTKKIRDSNPVPTNEVDNLILRVPDFEMVEDAKSID